MGHEATPRHTLNDQIIHDLIQDPDKLSPCHQELHPEQTNISSKDLENHTLDCDVLNQMYDDL